jgi:hypothetical protein
MILTFDNKFDQVDEAGGMFSFFFFFFCKSVESLTEHEWVPGSHVTIE